MAHLLHLSDLHLRSTPGKDTIGDAKATAIPAELQQTSARRIASTLEALARDVDTGSLTVDSIVVSGDIADRNDPDAYALLPTLLAPLVPRIVPADRVVVVPGNHDVVRGSTPSSRDRWQHFVTLRTHGYLTPLLEGVDITDQGTHLGKPRPPVLEATDGSFLIIALNSANHCQTQLPAETDLEPHLAELETLQQTNPATKALWNAWQVRGAVDPAWIGDGQQKAAHAALDAAAQQVQPDALRVAVMHHQLLPTGAIAEIKPFESLVNLGEILDWLADNRIDLALHGHKHAGRVYPYEHTAFHRSDTASGYRTLVISAPTAQAGYAANAPIARLISIDRPQPRTGGILVRDVPPLESGGRLGILARTPERFRLDAAVERGQIDGVRAEEVHQKLIALGGDYTGIRLPLMCRIEHGESASTIPSEYPDVPEGVTNRQAWFDQTVAWWQNERAGRAAAFNHGQRLLAFGTSRIASNERGLNQIDRAAHALLRKETSSRAIAVLVDPDVDLISDDSKFPAFVLVQFTIEAGRLNVTGYFRKQEMPHWWPINVAELAHLQKEVLARISDRPVHPGSITTITTQPVAGGGVPRVAIPALDTRVDTEAGMLDLVLPLFHPTAAPADQTLAEWRHIFDDWAPSNTPAADGDPMPLLGLRELAAILSRLASLYDTDAVRDILDQVNLISAACERFAAQTDGSPTDARVTWAADVSSRRARLIELVRRRLDER